MYAFVTIEFQIKSLLTEIQKINSIKKIYLIFFTLAHADDIYFSGGKPILF